MSLRISSCAALCIALAAACSSSAPSSGFDARGGAGAGGGDDGSGDPSGGGASDAGASGSFGTTGDSGGTPTAPPQQPDATVTVTTTIYANTDDTLYSMDPQTRAVTALGKVAGVGGGANDTSITDCAVDASGDLFVNTESALYKAALPASGGVVSLTRVATIAAQSGQRFYALAFVPAGVLGADEALVGGDGNGELWSIDPKSGATKDLGSFGGDPNDPQASLALSGDLVFYLDAQNKPTGMATIRSCKKSGGKSTCTKSNDYLAGVEMAALAKAFASGTPATSLLAGIYGGSATSTGNGTGHGELFGLGAWEGSVFGFARATTGGSGSPAALIAVDTNSGAGSVLPGSFPFTNGWSGAGVTTKVTVSVPPPPPAPPQPPPPK